MKIKNNVLFKSKLDLKLDLKMVLISTFAIILIAYFNDWLDLRLILALSTGIFYVYVIQTKLIELTDKEFIVRYPLLKALVKPKYFQLRDIEKFYFGSNDAAYSSETIKIYKKNGKKVKYSYSGNSKDQELINILREQGFEVEVNSHWWK